MLIILTSERELDNEAQKLNALFGAGLELLHFRKPTLDIEGYRKLLKKIDTKFYKRIMLHQYHELVTEFGLRGAHLQEQPRYDLVEDLASYVANFNTQGYKVSSSFHTKEEIAKDGALFEYVLLSPVFGSISKAGYEGKGFDVTDLPKHTIIGMGGINEQTIAKTYELGFKGIGVLGGIWNVDNYLDAFQSILRTDVACYVSRANYASTANSISKK